MNKKHAYQVDKENQSTHAARGKNGDLSALFLPWVRLVLEWSTCHLCVRRAGVNAGCSVSVSVCITTIVSTAYVNDRAHVMF